MTSNILFLLWDFIINKINFFFPNLLRLKNSSLDNKFKMLWVLTGLCWMNCVDWIVLNGLLHSNLLKHAEFVTGTIKLMNQNQNGVLSCLTFSAPLKMCWAPMDLPSLQWWQSICIIWCKVVLQVLKSPEKSWWLIACCAKMSVLNRKQTFRMNNLIIRL